MFLSQIAYPDCSPIMILSEASLADLNTRLEKKVKMDQFRPNIVVTGCDAFEEVSGSVLLCVMLRGAVQDTDGIAQTLQGGQRGKVLPHVTLTLWSSLIAAVITSLVSGGAVHLLMLGPPKQAMGTPNCGKSGTRLEYITIAHR